MSGFIKDMKITLIMPRVLKNIFDDREFLRVYDLLLPLSAHYQDVMMIHMEALKDCNPIIDLACGTGNLTIKYLEAGKTVTGYDRAGMSLRKLYDKAEEKGILDRITFVQGDIADLEEIKDCAFEGVSSMMAAHLSDDYEGHIREAHRVLKPGGVFVITARKEGGDQERLVRVLEASLKSQDVFEKYQSEFEILSQRLLRTAGRRSQSLLSTDVALDILSKSGFSTVGNVPNKTEGVMYTLEAYKT